MSDDHQTDPPAESRRGPLARISNAFQATADRWDKSLGFLQKLLALLGTLVISAGLLAGFLGIRLPAVGPSPSSSLVATAGPSSVVRGSAATGPDATPIAAQTQSSPIRETTVRTLQPYIDGLFLGEDYAVRETLAGDCMYGASLSSDFMALRCFTDKPSYVLDPCYANQTLDQVACIWSYFPKEAVVLEPVQIDEDSQLPAGDDSDPTIAFMEIRDDSGVMYGCTRLSSFAGEMEGRNRRYTCSGLDDRELQGSAFGDIDREHQPWKIFFSAADLDRQKPAIVVQAWR